MIVDQGRRVVEEAGERITNFRARWGECSPPIQHPNCTQLRLTQLMSPNLEVERRSPVSSFSDLSTLYDELDGARLRKLD